MSDFNTEEAVVKEYDSKLMKRLLKFAFPYKWHIMLVILLMLIMTVLDLVRPILIENAIDVDMSGYKNPYSIVSTYQDNSVKIGNSYIVRGKISNAHPASLVYKGKDCYAALGTIDYSKTYKIEGNKLIQGGLNFDLYKLTTEEVKVLRQNDINGIKNKTIIILLIVIIIFILNYLQVYLLEYTGQKIVFDIRQKLFHHIEGLSSSFFDKNPVGRLVTRVTNDIESLNEMYTGVLVYLFKDFFLMAGILIALFLLNRQLAFITISITPLIIAAAIVFKKYDRDAYRDVRVRLARINSFLSENISGMKTVQIFNKEEKKFKEFDGINHSYLKSTLRQITVFALFRPTIDFIYSLSLSLILWFGGQHVLGGSLKFGVLFAAVSYLQQFFQPVYDITEKYDILQSAMASSERIFMLFDNEDKIKNAENPVKLTSVKGEIEFKNVWFAYNENEWVLKDVSFKINPKEKVAFVGATGAGKTSIISLISRLYDIQKGEILLDGVNIKDIDLNDLRRNIASVLQDVFLFTGDIKSNIRLNSTEISDEEVINACKFVNADKFIEKLPDSYDSYVNERGSTFSQGQRQLIAFARAIAFRPPILVLDEATSNIDTETESLIQDALAKIVKDRTTIIVAHRLSTIRNADKIIVLHKGKIKEVGKHEELIEKQGLYYKLYKLQYNEAN